MAVLWIITALALSVDGLAAGISLGLRGVWIGREAKAAVALLSAGFSAVSVAAGGLLGGALPPALGKAVGGLLLVVLGSFSIRRALRRPDGAYADHKQPQPSHLPRPHSPHTLGRTALVVRDPGQGDLDQSGRIELWEAVLLGFSLSIDMLGAGLGLALGGAGGWWGLPAAFAAAQTLCLSLGNSFGRRLAHLSADTRLFEAASGLLLLLFGLAKGIL